MNKRREQPQRHLRLTKLRKALLCLQIFRIEISQSGYGAVAVVSFRNGTAIQSVMFRVFIFIFATLSFIHSFIHNVVYIL